MGLSDTAVCLLQVSGLERRFTQKHGVPEEEDVKCVIIKCLALKGIVPTKRK